MSGMRQEVDLVTSKRKVRGMDKLGNRLSFYLKGEKQVREYFVWWNTQVSNEVSGWNEARCGKEGKEDLWHDLRN